MTKRFSSATGTEEVNAARQDDQLRLLQQGVNASPNGFIIVDAQDLEMPVVFVNPAFTTMTGYSAEDVVGRNCRFLQGPDTDTDTVAAIRLALEEKAEISTALINYRKDGTAFWNQLTISPVVDEEGHCTHFVGIQVDITAEKLQEAQLSYQRVHDQITGLPNQAFFNECLESAFKASRPGNKLLVAMSIELDGFKTVIESLGPELSNQVLVVISQRVQRVLPAGVMFARLIGSEFGVLLPRGGSVDEAESLASSILDAVAVPLRIQGQRLHMSASVGLAIKGSSLQQPHQLLLNATQALQKAKYQGRNTWQWHHGAPKASQQGSLRLRHDLQEALIRDQLEIHYQPLVDSLTGRIRSLEALVRWQHPKNGMLYPGAFVGLAEDTGQIIPLGRRVLSKTCQEVAELTARSHRTLPVAVNISALQFRRDGFVEEVMAVLAETGLPPHLLELEITESLLLHDAAKVIEMMESLKALGVRVALDDFGTGFSSLSYLRDLPTHKLKLDRSFSQHSHDDHRCAAIVEGVVTMAHHLGMVVVGEGIESKHQWTDMANRSCDLLQGYLFSRPVPLGQLELLPDCLPASPSSTRARSSYNELNTR